MSSSLTLLFVAVLFFVLTLIYSAISESIKVRKRFQDLPWAGTENKTVWTLTRCRIENLFRFKQIFVGLNSKYWTDDKAVFVPLLTGDTILLPQSEYSWITDQPDDVLSNLAQLLEELQTDATLVEDYVAESRLHLTVITRDLTRQLTYLTDDVYDEVSTSIDQEWGVDTNTWKSVNPFTTIVEIVARTSSRVFVGLPLCRNRELNKAAVDFAGTVMPTAILLRRLPASMRPVLAPVVGYSNRNYRRKIAAILEPEIAARQHEASTTKESIRNDFLQWVINTASQSTDPKESDPNIIAQRLMIVNFAAIHTSSITLTNAIYNLVSLPSELYKSTLTTLREEIDSVLSSEPASEWTKHKISSLLYLDSFLRESTRHSPISVFAMTRKVVAKGGVTTPISHTYLPEGSSVAVPGLAVHLDPSVYKDPETFKPFRFMDMRDTTSANLSMSTTSLDYATFGHGRHACPGRFFAALELKLMLAYMVSNYDFERLDSRPENVWAGQICVPPVKGMVKIKRRSNV